MDFLVDFALNFYGPVPYLLVVGILLLCGLGLPLPEDITLFAGGLLSYYGLTNVWVMILVSFLGVIFGDGMLFFLGKRYGKQLTQRWFFRKLLTEERLNTVQLKFKQNGEKILFAARFMPGLRTPIFFSAGMLNVPFSHLVFYDGIAALISVPTIVGAVYYFGDQLDKVVRIVKNLEHGISGVIFVIVVIIVAKWYWKSRKLSKSNNQ